MVSWDSIFNLQSLTTSKMRKCQTTDYKTVSVAQRKNLLDWKPASLINYEPFEGSFLCFFWQKKPFKIKKIYIVASSLKSCIKWSKKNRFFFSKFNYEFLTGFVTSKILIMNHISVFIWGLPCKKNWPQMGCQLWKVLNLFFHNLGLPTMLSKLTFNTFHPLPVISSSRKDIPR